jgi:hypothetical protein
LFERINNALKHNASQKACFSLAPVAPDGVAPGGVTPDGAAPGSVAPARIAPAILSPAAPARY